MRFYLKLIFLLLILINFAQASDKIVFIDIDYILSNSNKGKHLINLLEKKNNENILKLTEKEKILKNKEKDIETKKNILSQEKINQEIDELKKQILNFRKEKDLIVEEFNSYKINQISQLMKEINPIITEYVKQNSIQMLIDKKNILIGKKEYDITNVILDLINKKLK